MNNEQSKPEHAALANDGPEWEIEAMLEEVWHQLRGRVRRTDILQVLLEILPRYADARVTLYLPILVHREAVEVLQARLDEATPDRAVRDAKPDSRTVKHDDLVTGIALSTGSSGS
jgi:biotin-(acetyl-CoA carboxylase) ligase